MPVATVIEGASIGMIVAVTRATDRDQGFNADISYSILGGDTAGQYIISILSVYY